MGSIPGFHSLPQTLPQFAPIYNNGCDRIEGGGPPLIMAATVRPDLQQRLRSLPTAGPVHQWDPGRAGRRLGARRQFRHLHEHLGCRGPTQRRRPTRLRLVIAPLAGPWALFCGAVSPRLGRDGPVPSPIVARSPRFPHDRAGAVGRGAGGPAAVRDRVRLKAGRACATELGRWTHRPPRRSSRTSPPRRAWPSPTATARNGQPLRDPRIAGRRRGPDRLRRRRPARRLPHRRRPLRRRRTARTSSACPAGSTGTWATASSRTSPPRWGWTGWRAARPGSTATAPPWPTTTATAGPTCW